MIKKEMVAMILAGGQGSRLKDLTRNVAKPAVAFGGKHKIVDFVLSNCTNSGIDSVGILTQYKPWALNKHIGVGKPWDLDTSNGGVTILPPYMGESGGDWYKGTADAIYQNLTYLDNLSPEYVLILSGDHIYKMDYYKMLKYHIKNSADATIAVINVSMNEASRFGIMNVNEDLSIRDFEEKPKKPKSTLASMGIYIFTYDVLRKYLIDDAKSESSAHDFGKNIIPNMLKNNKRMFAYPFDGYWRDIGTIESIWEANMDLISPDNKLNLYEDDWKIYTNSETLPPEYIGDIAKVKNSLISEGCIILGEVDHSIVFPGVYVAENAKVVDSVIMNGARILSGATVIKAIIGNNTTVNENNYIFDNEKILLVGNNKNIKPGKFLPKEER